MENIHDGFNVFMMDLMYSFCTNVCVLYAKICCVFIGPN